MKAAAARPRRIGLLGFGYVGRAIYRMIVEQPALGLEVAFVHNRDPARLAEVPAALRLADPAGFADRAPDLVVEMAHPALTQRFGAAFLARCDYLPLSVAALADDALRERLVATARAHGTVLGVPHGALTGLDSLVESRAQWAEVTITFRKHPRNIDFAESGRSAPTGREPQVLYDGPVRGIAPLYPRNINTMVTCALATVGLDRCRGVLVADPSLQVAVAEVEALGRDGSRLAMVKRQPADGVSGTEMIASQFASIRRLAGARDALAFV